MTEPVLAYNDVPAGTLAPTVPRYLLIGRAKTQFDSKRRSWLGPHLRIEETTVGPCLRIYTDDWAALADPHLAPVIKAIAEWGHPSSEPPPTLDELVRDLEKIGAVPL